MSEIRHGSLRIVRKCRVVTYLMGTDAKGRETIIQEVDEQSANDLIAAIADAQKGGPEVSP